MSFTEFFENLSQEINDTRSERRAGIQAIQTSVQNCFSSVHSFLDAFRSDRQRLTKEIKQKAKDLKKKLKTDDKARVKASHELMGEIRTRLGGIFSSTHDLLSDLSDDLRQGGKIFRVGSAASFAKGGPKESRRKKRK